MTPFSDIDLMLCGFETFDRAEIIMALELIERNLRRLAWIVQIKAVLTATVPVLKIVSLLKF